MKRILMLIIIATLIHAAEPQFTNVEWDDWYIITQDQPTPPYFIHAMDPDEDYPIDFLVAKSEEFESETFTSFKLENYNDTSAIMNFTPTNEDVGNKSGPKNYTIYILAEDSGPSEEVNTIRINFRIQNVNDPPVLKGIDPLSSITIEEGTTQEFGYNYTQSDIDIPWGDSLETFWYHDSILTNATNSTSGEYSIYYDYCSAGSHTMEVNITDLNGTSDSYTWDITVNNTNRPPEFKGPIANITLEEGEHLEEFLVLEDYFNDPDTECFGNNKDNITYSMINAVPEANITIDKVNGNHTVSINPEEYWFGNFTMRFRANDSYTTTDSNNISVIVDNVNNPPVFLTIPNQTTAQGAHFTLDLNDYLTDNDPHDTHTFTSNSSVFNTTDGLIDTIPSEVKNHTVNVCANDSINTTCTNLSIEVKRNNIPVLDPIDNQTETEGNLFQLIVNATDLDTEDNLTFSTNISWINVITIDNKGSASLEVQLMDNHTGNHTVQVTVTDSKGARDTENFSLEVIDINNPPQWQPLPEFNPRVNNSFSVDFSSYAEDLDLDDTHMYWDNTSLFNIQSSGLVQFTPDNISLTKVNLTVSDGEFNDSIIATFNITSNLNPRISNISINCREDYPCNFTINATDPDDDPLNYTSNLSFHNFSSWTQNNTLLVNLTANQSEVGLHRFNITVQDPYGGINSSTLTINITNTNDLPFFTLLENKTGGNSLKDDHTYEITIEAYDEDGDFLSFNVSPFLFNISSRIRQEIIGNTTIGTFNFTPEQPGNLTLNFSVTDGINTTYKKALYHIINVSKPPEITSFTPSLNHTISENTTQHFNITVQDPDSDILYYNWTINNHPVATTQNWSFTPDFCAEGQYNISINVSDGNLSTGLTWNLTVLDNNIPPILNSSIPNITIKKNQVKEILDLSDYFYQIDACNQSMDFNHTPISNMTLLFNGSRITAYPSTDFVGNITLEFIANDSIATTTSNTITIQVENNTAPMIHEVYHGNWTNKTRINLTTHEDTTITFMHNSSDKENDTILTIWSFDNQSYQTENLTKYFDYSSSGSHILNLTVSDNVTASHAIWNITVIDVNRPPTFGKVPLPTKGSFHNASFNDSFTATDGKFISEPKDTLDDSTYLVKPDFQNIEYTFQSNHTSKTIGERNASSTTRSFNNVSNTYDKNYLTYWEGESPATLSIGFNTTTFIRNISISTRQLVTFNISYTFKGTSYHLLSSECNGNLTLTIPPTPMDHMTFNFTGQIQVNEIGLYRTSGATLQARTSYNANAWSEWSDPLSNQSLFHQENLTQNMTYNWDNRYIQYALTMSNTTVNRPVLNMKIPDFVMKEEYDISPWIDLDHYFSDKDNDTLNFSIIDIQNSENLGISINEENHIRLSPETDWFGVASFRIKATDPSNTSIESNNITITVIDTYDQPPPENTGGGGGETQRVIVPFPEEKNVTQPEFLQLITPRRIIKTDNNSIMIPLTLTNKGNVTLRQISLDAQSNESVEFTYDDNPINLAPQESHDTQIEASWDDASSISINISAQAQEPDVMDFTLVSITPLEGESLNNEVKFVRDLLSSNPECLELNEQISRAQDMIKNNQATQAKELLQNTVDTCRYLISSKDQQTEQPEEINEWKHYLQKNRIPLIIIGSILSLLILILIGIVLAANYYNRREFS
ncbi:MAG: Ig-like domain-containing protein [Candidatus Woesearchaeota archaeon]